MSPRSRPTRSRPARNEPEVFDPGPERGHHTLEVRTGQIVGIDAPDVFVDLGPRLQGVIPLVEFDGPPSIGDMAEFTLRGQEDGLWALELSRTLPSPRWEKIEIGTLVEARVTAKNPGGLDLKLGKLHGFMPRSETGLPRRADPAELIGTRLQVEVIDVEVERQRVILSRKAVLKREREGRHRDALRLRPGQTVAGRVSRLMPFGAMVRLSSQVEGLLHVSDIDHERVADVADVLTVGDSLKLLVLSVKRGGRRVGLGLKQLKPSPWKALQVQLKRGGVMLGEVTRVADYGAFLRLAPGIVGLMHISEADMSGKPHPGLAFKPGMEIAVRAFDLDLERERVSLSMFHPSGRAVHFDEARPLVAVQPGPTAMPEPPPARLETDEAASSSKLGSLLSAALRPRNEASGHDPEPA